MIKTEEEIIWESYVSESMSLYDDPTEGFDSYDKFDNLDELKSAINQYIKENKIIFDRGEKAKAKEIFEEELPQIRSVANEEYLSKFEKDHRFKDKEDRFEYTVALKPKNRNSLDIMIEYVIPPSQKFIDYTRSRGDWYPDLEEWVSYYKGQYQLKIKES